MPEDIDNNQDEKKPESLEDIIGSKLTVKQSQDKVDAAVNLNNVLKRLTSAKTALAVKVKLFTMLERLANYGKLRMPKQFNKEAKLNNNKNFYAVKPHKNIRAYGWFSNKEPGVFFISHYKYKNKQKLDSIDTRRVKSAWRGIEDE